MNDKRIFLKRKFLYGLQCLLVGIFSLPIMTPTVKCDDEPSTKSNIEEEFAIQKTQMQNRLNNFDNEMKIFAEKAEREYENEKAKFFIEMKNMDRAFSETRQNIERKRAEIKKQVEEARKKREYMNKKSFIHSALNYFKYIFNL